MALYPPNNPQPPSKPPPDRPPPPSDWIPFLSHLSRHHPHRSNLIRRTIRLAHFGSLLPQTTERKAARHSLPIILLRCGPSISS
jgi:hypothetical protein